MASAADPKTVALMRRFTSLAPPGHMQLVLKSLKQVMRDDATFFAAAPRLALEQLASIGLPVRLPNGAGVLVLSKAAHASTWATSCESSREAFIAKLRESELGEEYLEFAFIDWHRRALCVVDPLVGSVVSSVMLRDLECHDAALEALMTPTQPKVLQSPLGFSGLALRVATFLALRDGLERELSHYAARRYSEASVAVSVAVDMAALSAPTLASDDPALSVSDGKPKATYSIPVLHCNVCAERRHETANWAGRWVTSVVLHMSDLDSCFSIDGDTGGVRSPAYVWARGAMRMDFMYHEAGNIQMESQQPIDFVTTLAPHTDGERPTWIAPDGAAAKALVASCASSITAPVRHGPSASGVTELAQPLPESFLVVARRIARQLELNEDAIQERIAEASRGPSLSDAAMRPLRRKLPVTRQLYQFGAAGRDASVRMAFNRPPQSSAAGDEGDVAEAAGEDE